MAWKVEDNVMCIVMAPIIMLQPTMPSNPAANLLHDLLKVPNAMVINQVHMPSDKLEAAKL